MGSTAPMLPSSTPVRIVRLRWSIIEYLIFDETNDVIEWKHENNDLIIHWFDSYESFPVFKVEKVKNHYNHQWYYDC